MKIAHALVLAGALSCLAAPRVVAAQEHATDRGSLILGGSAGFTRTTYSNLVDGRTVDTHNSYAHLAPTLQYFVSPGLALGGTIQAARYSQGGTSSTSYGAGPIASYYFGRAEQKLRPYVSGNGTLYRSTGEGEGAYGWGASAGSLYMLSRAVGLNAGVFYQRHGRGGSETSHSNLGLSLGFSAFTF